MCNNYEQRIWILTCVCPYWQKDKARGVKKSTKKRINLHRWGGRHQFQLRRLNPPMIIPVTWVWCSLLPGASPPHQRCLLHYPSNLTLNSSNCRKNHPSSSQVQWTDGAGSTLSKLMASDCFPGLFSTEVLVLLVYSTAVDWNPTVKNDPAPKLKCTMDLHCTHPWISRLV